MLRYIYADHLSAFPHLSKTMFQDRAEQFKTRLGWDVTVNTAGEERDEYDDLLPLYVIWELPDGSHGGSMRLLPTTGPAMVNDHFSDLLDGTENLSPLWGHARCDWRIRARGQPNCCGVMGNARRSVSQDPCAYGDHRRAIGCLVQGVSGYVARKNPTSNRCTIWPLASAACRVAP